MTTSWIYWSEFRSFEYRYQTYYGKIRKKKVLLRDWTFQLLF